MQQQLQILAQQQQQIAAQAEAVRQEALALQQQPVAGQPFDPALPYAPVRQFDPNAPIPPQPPMLLPPAPPVPPAPFVPLPAQPQFAPPAARPLPAEDFVNTFRNPSTGGDHPVLALITPAEVKQALRQGVRLVMLDVRDGLARDVEGIIPGSVSVPYEPYETFAARVTRVIPLRGDFPVVVFCSDGTASAKATEVLAKMGYSAYLMGAYRLWADIPQQPFAATALQPY